MNPIRPHSTAILLAVLWCAAAPDLGAEAVYKSVDSEGNVTYSGTPPPAGTAREVEELAIDPDPEPDPESGNPNTGIPDAQGPEPSGQERSSAAAEARAQRQDAVSAAQQDLIRAKAELEQAKIPGDGDWQWLVRGGRVLSAAYFERVAAAESRVEAAEQALQAARRGR
jgi:hypothetical protein